MAGLDEAGRGPLAGPVVAAAVVFEATFLLAEENGRLRGLTDSKKLSASQREDFFALFKEVPGLQLGVGQADVAEIATLNILQATHLAMRRALDALAPPAEHVLVDGLPVRDLPCPATAIVGGDGLSLSVAAASVVAKVTRDAIMAEIDRTCPGYGFARHKGYGTPQHLQALRERGPSPWHRKTFRPVAQLELGIAAPIVD